MVRVCEHIGVHARSASKLCSRAAPACNALMTLRAKHKNIYMYIRVALNGERYPPFTVHRLLGDG
eukprot:26768-Chlamydomonas_euryale.AAC.1